MSSSSTTRYIAMMLFSINKQIDNLITEASSIEQTYENKIIFTEKMLKLREEKTKYVEKTTIKDPTEDMKVEELMNIYGETNDMTDKLVVEVNKEIPNLNLFTKEGNKVIKKYYEEKVKKLKDIRDKTKEFLLKHNISLE